MQIFPLQATILSKENQLACSPKSLISDETKTIIIFLHLFLHYLSFEN